MDWRPNKFVAALLGFFIQPLSMLYVARVKWAIFYLMVPLFILIIEFIYSAPQWLIHLSINSLVSIICALHAYRLASSGVHMLQPWYSRWYGLLAIFVIYLSTVFGFRSFFYEPYRMPSGSMLPNINIGSYVVAQKFGYGNYGTYGLTLTKAKITSSLSRGDLLVFEHPENPSGSYIKRLIGMPGDIIAFKNHQLTINGHPVSTEVVTKNVHLPNDRSTQYVYMRESLPDTTYLVAYTNDTAQPDFEVVVPPYSYFVLGDNRDNSRDSRHWGFVPQENIVGKVIFISK